MHFLRFRLGALLCLMALALGGCGRESKPAGSAASVTVGDQADALLGIPVGWSDANRKSAEYYIAGNYVEAIAVLEAFAKSNPKFADAELMLGDHWLTMPSHPDVPQAARLDKALQHFRHGLKLATDDDTRDWATSSLLRTSKEQKRLATTR